MPTEEMNFRFYLILTNLNLSSQMGLAATILNSAAPDSLSQWVSTRDSLPYPQGTISHLVTLVLTL